jgi:hypothetical protein
LLHYFKHCLPANSTPYLPSDTNTVHPSNANNLKYSVINIPPPSSRTPYYWCLSFILPTLHNFLFSTTCATLTVNYHVRHFIILIHLISYTNYECLKHAPSSSHLPPPSLLGSNIKLITLFSNNLSP